MEIEVKYVINAEMYRDGGSYGISLRANNNDIYDLDIMVNIKIVNSGEWKRISYDNPVLLKRGANKAFNVHWESALQYLSAPFEKPLSDIHQAWFDEAKLICRNKGTVPEQLKWVGNRKGLC